MNIYHVVVGNIGTVYTGASRREADYHFRTYREQSRDYFGRAAGEPVTLTSGDGTPIREYEPRVKLPTVRDLTALVRAVKRDIAPEYRAFGDDDTPGIQLTVGWRPNGAWSYQTGDNSYSGGAYHYPHWVVVGVYRGTNARDVARDIRRQLLEAIE